MNAGSDRIMVTLLIAQVSQPYPPKGSLSGSEVGVRSGPKRAPKCTPPLAFELQTSGNIILRGFKAAREKEI